MRTVDIYRVTFLVVIAIVIKYLPTKNIYVLEVLIFILHQLKKRFFYTFESQNRHVYLIFQILFGVYFDL